MFHIEFCNGVVDFINKFEQVCWDYEEEVFQIKTDIDLFKQHPSRLRATIISIQIFQLCLKAESGKFTMPQMPLHVILLMSKYTYEKAKRMISLNLQPQQNPNDMCYNVLTRL